MSKHTPGPWKVFLVKEGPNKGQLLGIGEQRDGMGVTDAYGGLWGSGGEKLANAHLIAAAPELLEALVEILGPLNVCSDNPNIRDDTSLPIDLTMGEMRKARAAIAKARGDQSL